jgi:hypothetical protein
MSVVLPPNGLFVNLIRPRDPFDLIDPITGHPAGPNLRIDPETLTVWWARKGGLAVWLETEAVPLPGAPPGHPDELFRLRFNPPPAPHAVHPLVAETLRWAPRPPRFAFEVYLLPGEVRRHQRRLDRYARARVGGGFPPAHDHFDFEHWFDPDGTNFTSAAWEAVRAAGVALPGVGGPSRLDGAYLF